MGLGLEMDDETQYRCAGYIQAEIERYSELLGIEGDEDNMSDDESDEDEEAAVQKRRKRVNGNKDGKCLLSRLSISNTQCQKTWPLKHT